MKAVQLPYWVSPLDAASAIQEECWVLLYSGVRTNYSGRYSLLAHGLKEEITADHFADFSPKLSDNHPWHENMWFGYLGYDLKHDVEKLAAENPSVITLPRLHMLRFAHIWQFDHEEKKITCFSEKPDALPQVATKPQAIYEVPKVATLQSNMSGTQYRQHVDKILTHIKAGDLYQANLTRKFHGNFASAPDSFALFSKLCAVSPAPYSAFLKLGDTSILSSSPELFLQVDPDGRVRTRPIKGTSPRFTDEKKDKESLRALQHSEKDQAENLMIVDLMRNDLSRACVPGSITTSDRFEVTSHANVHHMSTTIHGQKRPECSTLELVQHCFPPGSMTGAPKIRAMQLCTALEQQSRGIYAGAIGFFDGSGGCELSVVIRTLILQGSRFEFQVGGGIVVDSSARAEEQEIFAKASGLLQALGVAPGALAEL